MKRVQAGPVLRRLLLRASVAALAAGGMAPLALAQPAAGAAAAKAAPKTAPKTATSSATGAQRILVVGDSLSAEYGIARGRGWVALAEQATAAEGLKLDWINASISGDTTAGGAARLPALLKRHTPQWVLIELGGNDALRGLPLDHTRANLQRMVAASRAAGAQPVLIGMQMPPNYGARYGAQFQALYAELAQQEKVALVPFLLAGIADAPDADRAFQADRIHPLAVAHPRMRDNVLQVLRPLLKKAGAGR